MGIHGFHLKRYRSKEFKREHYADNTSGDYDTPGLQGAELKMRFPEVEDAVMLKDVYEVSAVFANITGMSSCKFVVQRNCVTVQWKKTIHHWLVF